MKKKSRISQNTKIMTGIAAFSALAYGVSLVTNIKIGFLTFDAKDAVITVASFIYGPLSAAVMSLITAFLEFVSIGSTGPWGALMDFVSTFSFTFTAAIIYKYRRNLSGALIALGTASITYVAVMMMANLIITPIYMGVGVDAVKAMIPTTLLPFNTAKALMNSALVMLIYKPIVKLTRRIGLAKSKSESKSGGKIFTHDTVIMATIAICAMLVAIVIFVMLSK